MLYRLFKSRKAPVLPDSEQHVRDVAAFAAAVPAAPPITAAMHDQALVAKFNNPAYGIPATERWIAVMQQLLGDIEALASYVQKNSSNVTVLQAIEDLSKVVQATASVLHADHREIIFKLDVLRSALVVPGDVAILQKREANMAMQFGLVFSLPPASASDVVKQQLTVTDNQGSEPIVRSYDATATETDEFLVPKVTGLVLTTELVDLDGDGNASRTHTQTHEVKDDIAPPEPGDVGIKNKREVDTP